MSPFQRLAAALAALRGRVHPALPAVPARPALPSRPAGPAVPAALDAAALRAGFIAQAQAAADLRENALANVAKLDAATNALTKP